jgi:hypothetical protein
MHDLGELGRGCARACPSLGPLVPRDASDGKRLAALLRASYVDAGYSFAFQVSRTDLETLAGYVCAFRMRAEWACRGRLAELEEAAHAVAGGEPERRRWACASSRAHVGGSSMPGHHTGQATKFARPGPCGRHDISATDILCQ